MSKSVHIIGIFFVKLHSDSFCCFDGRYIGILAIRKKHHIVRILECPVSHRTGSFCGVTSMLTVFTDMVSYFWQLLSINVLKC